MATLECHIKNLARSFVWWPGMDADWEEFMNTCQACQLSQYAPARAPLHPWEWPQRPRACLHVYYAGPFLGKIFLVVVDEYSKWMEVAIVNSATSGATIKKLQSMFAIHGLPEILVSNNGSQFYQLRISETVMSEQLCITLHPMGELSTLCSHSKKA